MVMGVMTEKRNFHINWISLDTTHAAVTGCGGTGYTQFFNQ
jgi:hypothetical protein